MCYGKRYPPAESSRSWSAWFQGTTLEEVTDYLRMSSKQLETLPADTHTESAPPAAIAPAVCTVASNARTRQGDGPCPGSRPLRRQSSSRGRFRRSLGGVGSQDLHDKRPFLTRFLMSMGHARSALVPAPHRMCCIGGSAISVPRCASRGRRRDALAQRRGLAVRRVRNLCSAHLGPCSANPPPRTRRGAWWPCTARTRGPPGWR